MPRKLMFTGWGVDMTKRGHQWLVFHVFPTIASQMIQQLHKMLHTMYHILTSLHKEDRHFFVSYLRHPIQLKPSYINSPFCLCQLRITVTSSVNSMAQMTAGPERVVLPCSSSVCIIHKCRLVRDGLKTASKANKKKVREKPCWATDGCVWVLQSQEQIWCYRNSNTESTCLTRWTCQSHFWANQLSERTSQAASVPTNMGYTTSQSEAVRLTHERSYNNCSFVQLLTASSFTLAVSSIWLYLSVITLSEEAHKQRPINCVPICLCSLWRNIFSRVRKASEGWTDRQTDVTCLHPALLFKLTQDRMHRAPGCLHTMLTNTHVSTQISGRNNRRQIFHS